MYIGFRGGFMGCRRGSAVYFLKKKHKSSEVGIQYGKRNTKFYILFT